MLPALVDARPRFSKTLAMRAQLLQAWLASFAGRKLGLLDLDGAIWLVDRGTGELLSGQRFELRDGLLLARAVEATAWQRHRIHDAFDGRLEAVWLSLPAPERPR